MTDNTDDFETLKEEALSRIQDFMNLAYDDRFLTLFSEAEDSDLHELADKALDLYDKLSQRALSPRLPKRPILVSFCPSFFISLCATAMLFFLSGLILTSLMRVNCHRE